MVLLSSGHVTIILSSILVSLFTFLLFMSGYVLQQQTVKSLQEAIHPPPLPSPTLPTYFSDLDNTTDAFRDAERESAALAEEKEGLFKPIRGSSRQEVMDYVKTVLPAGVEMKQIQISDANAGVVEAQLEGAPKDQDPSKTEKTVSEPLVSESNTAQQEELTGGEESEEKPESPLAYLTLASHPSAICSSILLYSHLSFFASFVPNRLVVYPSFWDDPEVASDSHSTALALLKKAVHDHQISILPVRLPAELPVSDLTTTELELAMLSSLTPATFSTLNTHPSVFLYIRGPGLLTDASLLDRVISSPTTGDWTPIPSPTSPAFFPEESSHNAPPSHLLIQLASSPSAPKERQISFNKPTSKSTSALVLSAITSNGKHVSDLDIEAKASRGSGVAYILFSEDDMKHRRGEKEWYNGVFERYDRGSREVCPSDIEKILENKGWAGQNEGGLRVGGKDRGRGW